MAPGTVVSARPSGWNHKGHLDGPQLDGIREVVRGALQGWLVDERDHGRYYFSTSSAAWMWTRHIETTR